MGEVGKVKGKKKTTLNIESREGAGAQGKDERQLNRGNKRKIPRSKKWGC